METFTIFIHITFFQIVDWYQLASMQLTWGRVGGKPLYAEYQINIGNTNNRVTWPMKYVLLTSNSYEITLNTSQ